MQLKDWAYVGNYAFFTSKIRSLAANELPAEKWNSTGREDFNILKSYLYFTFEKLWADYESASNDNKSKYIYMDDSVACFNTGLFDKSWQPIYFYCERNNYPGHQDWLFKSFLNSYTIKFAGISSSAAADLQRANYFTDPSSIIFDFKLEIVPQWKHIIHDTDNFLRIPEVLRNSGKEFCQNLIDGAIRSVRKRIESNYKTIVPQFYQNKIQLLAPLYLTNEDKPDLALVLSLSDDKTVYYGHTCLTTEMAYNNARLIARPDSYWLQP